MFQHMRAIYSIVRIWGNRQPDRNFAVANVIRESLCILAVELAKQKHPFKSKRWTRIEIDPFLWSAKPAIILNVLLCYHLSQVYRGC